MFKFDGLCEDKNLPNILRALASAGALNVQAVPVIDAVVRNGKVTSASNGSGLPPAPHTVWERIRTAGITEFTSADVVEHMTAAGLAPLSRQYALETLIKAKLIKRVSKGNYKVLS